MVSGNYLRHSSANLWPRVETIVWLDLPLRVLIPRILVRSWGRARRKEVLWGTNTESFWKHLKVWDQKDSLIAYAIFGRKRQNSRLLAAMVAPAFAHIRFIRLRSSAEIETFVRDVEHAVHG